MSVGYVTLLQLVCVLQCMYVSMYVAMYVYVYVCLHRPIALRSTFTIR